MLCLRPVCLENATCTTMAKLCQGLICGLASMANTHAEEIDGEHTQDAYART